MMKILSRILGILTPRHFFDFMCIIFISVFFSNSSVAQTPSGIKTKIFEKSLHQFSSGPLFFVERIEVEGNKVFDDMVLSPLIDLGAGREISIEELNQLAQNITGYYARRGYILTRAFVPEQKVEDGVVILKVVEGTIGNIHIKGNRKLNREDFLNRLKAVQKAPVFREQSLEEILLGLNDIPGVSVRSTLRPGKFPGTSDLLVNVTETSPYAVRFDADNFGSRFTGENRFGLTGKAANLLSLGDLFHVRGVKSDDDLNYIQSSYSYFFNEWGFSANFSYTYSDFALGEGLGVLKAGGDANLFELKFGYPLFRNRQVKLNIDGGVEYRRYENNVLSISTRDEIGDVFIQLNGNARDPYLGQTFFDLRLQQGFTESDEARTNASRSGGRGDVLIAGADLTRYQYTNVLNSYFILNASGQLADDRVLASDEFFIGGIGTVRGFPLAEFSGDHGYLVSAEYVLPFPKKVPLGLGGLTLDEVLSLRAFIDHGATFVAGTLAGESEEVISGYGLGLTVHLPEWSPRAWISSASFSLIYAKPLAGPNPTDGSEDTFYLNGELSF